MNCLSKKVFSDFWFETGTPTILTKLIKKFNIDPQIFDSGFEASKEMFDAPPESAEDATPMLYQSGYLTIRKFDGYAYTLGFPNNEVRFGFLKCLMPYYASQTVSANDSFIIKFSRTFRENKLEDALILLKSFLSSVPYNAEKQTESHYKTLLYLICKLCTPYVVKTEECSAAGRTDMLIETEQNVYLFEFKLNDSVQDALNQIDKKGYLIPYVTSTDKYGNRKKLYKIGVNFDSTLRTICEWKIIEE